MSCPNSTGSVSRNRRVAFLRANAHYVFDSVPAVEDVSPAAFASARSDRANSQVPSLPGDRLGVANDPVLYPLSTLYCGVKKMRILPGTLPADGRSVMVARRQQNTPESRLAWHGSWLICAVRNRMPLRNQRTHHGFHSQLNYHFNGQTFNRHRKRMRMPSNSAAPGVFLFRNENGLLYRGKRYSC
jgi:hypothetical protein